MNIIPATPHPMLSEGKLCWLNSSIQLILSDNILVNSMLQQPLFSLEPKNKNANQCKIIINASTDLFSLSDFYSKMDEITIRFLCDLLNSPPTKPLEKLVIEKYIEDVRQHGPKLYLYGKNEYLPLIQSIGQLSSIDTYLSSVLLNSVSNFIDIRAIWNNLLICSECQADNILATESQSLLKLKLFTFNCKESSLPDAALEYFFLTENSFHSNTCNTCGDASDQNNYRKELVQLPDALFLLFIPTKSTQKDDNNTVESTEFFIKNHLDMSKFASSQLVCDTSYFKYQLRSFIISMGDTDDSRHYYTFAKYGEQFYRCNDELIEPVDKAVVFERKYSILSAMYIREKVHHVNFVEIIYQILLNDENFTLSASTFKTHVMMMFDAALEHVARDTKALCWSFGAAYRCPGCKLGEF
jgi:hypothetical protein